MSAQIIELLIFVAIAFFIINKLIATLGMTTDDPTKKKSYFGEPVAKDITNTVKYSDNKFKEDTSKEIDIKVLGDLIVTQNLTEIVDGIEILKKRIESFHPIKFINNAKMAFQMIIEATFKEQNSELEQLVDKRFLEGFKSSAFRYGDFVDSTALTAKYLEIYMFGNNVFIKLLFEGKNIVEKIVNLQEEWTFTRNLNTIDVDWFLSNIEDASVSTI